MSNCSSRALTLLSSVFGACGLLLVGIAVSTDYWMYVEEGIVLPQNQTTEVKMALHAGLWRVCFVAGKSINITGIHNKMLHTSVFFKFLLMECLAGMNLCGAEQQ